MKPLTKAQVALAVAKHKALGLGKHDPLPPPFPQCRPGKNTKAAKGRAMKCAEEGAKLADKATRKWLCG